MQLDYSNFALLQLIFIISKVSAHMFTYLYNFYILNSTDL